MIKLLKVVADHRVGQIKFGGTQWSAPTFFLFIIIFASSIQADQSFDAQQAFLHVKNQVDFGPHPSGSEEIKKTRDYIGSQLKKFGYTVTEQSFEDSTPRGKIKFTNIRARLPQSTISKWLSKPALVIASHYDTKWFKDIRFVGANDGGSSTGVLLEIARVVSVHKSLSKRSIEFVFFDGEEAIESFTETDGLYGSRHYVKQLKHGEIESMILLDMVGDGSLSVLVSNDAPDLSSKVYKAAEDVKARDYFHPLLGAMIDDHTPFVKAGIPAVDLIDFDYGPGNRFWHTNQDTIDKISPESLKIIGQTILKFLELYDSHE